MNFYCTELIPSPFLAHCVIVLPKTIFVNHVDTVGVFQGCLKSTFYLTSLLIGNKSQVSAWVSSLIGVQCSLYTTAVQTEAKQAFCLWLGLTSLKFRSRWGSWKELCVQSDQHGYITSPDQKEISTCYLNRLFLVARRHLCLGLFQGVCSTVSTEARLAGDKRKCEDHELIFGA